MIAVSDTGPLLYLSLIDQTGLLPQLFRKVLVPEAVAEELSRAATPARASVFISRCPAWLEIHSVPLIHPSIVGLDRGERQAITLAISAGAGVLLTDDASAKKMATQTMAIAASGTIGVLYEAAKDDLVAFSATNFDRCVDQLLATRFRRSPSLLKIIEELSRELHDGGVSGSGS